MYSDGVTGGTLLRGVQVTFDSLVPGCYTGRWPHIHCEVFTSIDGISDAKNNVFSDGWDEQTPTVTGSVADGYAVSIDVPVDPTTKSQGVAQANESA